MGAVYNGGHRQTRNPIIGVTLRDHMDCINYPPVNPRDPGTQIIPTLGPKVCKYYLHWAIWVP